MRESLKDGDKFFHSLCRSLDRHVFPLLSRECTEEQGNGGNKEIGVVGDRWKDHGGLLMFYLYTCLYR